MSEKVFDDITEIVAHAEFTIGDDGIIQTTAAECSKRDEKLFIGGDQASSGSGNSIFNFSGNSMSISGGTSTCTMNGIKVSAGSGVISLRGPETTRLIVNGVETLFARVVGMIRSLGGVSAAASAVAQPKRVFRLGAKCAISAISLQSSGQKSAFVSPLFLSESLRIQIRNSGDMCLPSMKFENLQISIAGSGDVYAQIRGETQTAILAIQIAGSGDCKGITALGLTSIMIAGSGDVQIFAKDRRLVNKQVAGSGSVRIDDAPEDARADAENSKKRKTRDGDVVERPKKERP